uniref:M-phase phosphoprotein 6 n=1 Tax=Oryza nivara TaxID=4536 RepID=A0A0E0FG41_ORYNI
MAAKRELSSTLRNLKFMQRAAVAQKVEEKPKVEAEAAAAAAAAAEEEEEVVTVPSGGVGSSVKVARKCVVIMEGNPHPGAVKGRMSFLNFNPSIDKLTQEATSGRQSQSASPSNNHQDGSNSSRTDEVPRTRFSDFNIDSSESISLNELKRKQPELDMETPPSHRQPKTTGKSVDGDSSSQSNGRGSHKSNKREKLDWNLLRPRKSK